VGVSGGAARDVRDELEKNGKTWVGGGAMCLYHGSSANRALDGACGGPNYRGAWGGVVQEVKKGPGEEVGRKGEVERRKNPNGQFGIPEGTSMKAKQKKREVLQTPKTLQLARSESRNMGRNAMPKSQKNETRHPGAERDHRR